MGIILARVFLGIGYRYYKKKTKVKVSEHVCCIIRDPDSSITIGRHRWNSFTGTGIYIHLYM